MTNKLCDRINHREYDMTSKGNPQKELFTSKTLLVPITLQSVYVVFNNISRDNELKILHHKYGDNPKVAKDPKRINWGELLHHVPNNLPMEHLDPSKLGEGGVVQKIDKASGIKQETMCITEFKQMCSCQEVAVPIQSKFMTTTVVEP
ncbi:hypothetical protein ACHAW6_003990 [Cyclotella cf. meneghiniana]